MKRSTRSTAATGSKAHMTLEDQVKAIERDAQRQVLRQQTRAQRALERENAEKKEAEQKASEQETSGQKAAEGEISKQGTPSDDSVLEQSFDFDVLSGSDSDTSAMDLDPEPPLPQPQSTLSRLQLASAAADPAITFPFNRVLPKAAVFLLCQGTHVFFLASPAPSSLSASLSLPLPAADYSHAVAHVAAPCPQCVIPAAPAAVHLCRRKCPFCMMPMPELPDGRRVCLTSSCWFARCAVEAGSDAAVAVWREAWRVMGNRYFFVGPWEEVLSFSNDLNRDAEDKWAGDDFTV